MRAGHSKVSNRAEVCSAALKPAPRPQLAPFGAGPLYKAKAACSVLLNTSQSLGKVESWLHRARPLAKRAARGVELA